jgi:hypothetical protein
MVPIFQSTIKPEDFIGNKQLFLLASSFVERKRLFIEIEIGTPEIIFSIYKNNEKYFSSSILIEAVNTYNSIS